MASLLMFGEIPSWEWQSGVMLSNYIVVILCVLSFEMIKKNINIDMKNIFA